VALLSGCGGGAEVAAAGWQEQYDLGLRYLSEGGYEEAVVAFTAAIEIDPKQAVVYVGRGDAYVGLEQHETAVPDYEQAITLDESVAEVYFKLADSYIALGEEDKAREALERGLAATGDSELFGGKLAQIMRPQITLTEAELQLLLPLEQAMVAQNVETAFALWSSAELLSIFAGLPEAEKSYTYKYLGEGEWTIARSQDFYLNYWQGGRDNGVHFGATYYEGDYGVGICTFPIVEGKANGLFEEKTTWHEEDEFGFWVYNNTSVGNVSNGLYQGEWTFETASDEWRRICYPQYDNGTAINYQEVETGYGWVFEDSDESHSGWLQADTGRLYEAFVGFE
jgi:hypothetical protein